MKQNRSLLPVTLAGIAGPALLLCIIGLGIIPRGFAADTAAWSIQVEPVTADEGQLPPDFSMAVYENLIDRLVKTNTFQHVYRSGDRHAESVPNLLILHMTLLNFERGNETQRAVTTVKGATKVQVHLKVSARDGNALVEKDVQGTVRFFGENLRATYALAKRIAETLRDASLPAPGTTKAAGQ